MTFHEGTQIDTSTTSSSGGGPGRGIAIGGGLGGLVIVIVALLLGVDPSTVTTAPQPGQQQQQEVGRFDVSQCKTAADANKIPECRIIATGNSVDAVWTQLMGRQYTRPHIRLFKGQVGTACGAATTDVGPFYCPADEIAYFDTDFLAVLRDQLGSSTGPFAQEYIVAHEFGHHVQDLLGDLGRAQKPNAAQGAEGAGVRTELQADCYAGVWAHYATIPQSNGTTYLDPLTDKDIRDVMSATQSVGDDWIQKRTTGRVDPYSFTHGTSAQRQHWFTVGYQLGDPKRCDTFSASDLG